MRNFKALLETSRESSVAPGRCNQISKLACTADGGNWDALTTSADWPTKDKVKEYRNRKEGKEQFITALHFDGLNLVTYVNVKSDVHNG